MHRLQSLWRRLNVIHPLAVMHPLSVLHPLNVMQPLNVIRPLNAFHLLDVIHLLSATKPSNVMTQPSQPLNVLIYPLTETFLPNAIQQLDDLFSQSTVELHWI